VEIGGEERPAAFAGDRQSRGGGGWVLGVRGTIDRGGSGKRKKKETLKKESKNIVRQGSSVTE